MLRSNSKAARAAVREFILDYIKRGTDTEGETDEELVRNYYDATMDALSTDKWHHTPLDKLKYDLDCGGWECGTYERRKLVQEWLQETDEEAARFSDDQAEEQFKYLVAREIMKIAKVW